MAKKRAFARFSCQFKTTSDGGGFLLGVFVVSPNFKLLNPLYLCSFKVILLRSDLRIL